MNKKVLGSIRKYSLLSGVLILLLLIVIIGFKNSDSSNDLNNQQKETEVVDNKDASVKEKVSSVETETTVSTLKEEDPSVISEEVNGKINDLVKDYYNASQTPDTTLLADGNKEDGKEAIETITDKREGIEAYKNVSTYIRTGMEENTYVVFTTYDTKFFNIDTVAPGMSVLYVQKDADGYVIQEDTSAAKLSVYIQELSKEQEIATIIDTVNTGLVNAMNRDAALEEFINKLKEESK